MRSGGLFTGAALATVFVLPAVTMQGAGDGSLGDALQRTLAALESLAQLEGRVQAGDPEALRVVLASTEPALPPELRGDDTLVTLRGEVSDLERRLDDLHSGAETFLPGHTGVRTDLDSDLGPLPVATLGLDETTRKMLGALKPGGTTGALSTTSPSQPATTSTPRTSGPAQSAKQAFEPEGYTADALRLARVYYNQGRWDDALTLLDGREYVAVETYWRARCLEKLGRNDEAQSAYAAVAADPAAGDEAQRAQEDLDFLRWRLDFAARQKAAKQKGSK